MKHRGRKVQRSYRASTLYVRGEKPRRGDWVVVKFKDSDALRLERGFEVPLLRATAEHVGGFVLDPQTGDVAIS